MFFEDELKGIQEAKTRMAIRCDLRRSLLHMEVQGVWSGVHRTFSNLTLALAIAEQIFDFLHKRKTSRQ
jgi:hypothetical protein